MTLTSRQLHRVLERERESYTPVRDRQTDRDGEKTERDRDTERHPERISQFLP